MSEVPKWQKVNAMPESVALDMSTCCHPTSRSGSAIDQFYETIAHVLTLGDPRDLVNSPTLGRLLLMGLVTATESYFREVLFGVIKICPLARESVADKLVALGASDYYGPDRMALALFENTSFAGRGEVEAKTSQIAGVKWSPQSSLGVALSNYEQVCHIRHAAIHAHGVLNRGNAKALGVLGRRGESLHVVIDLAHLHYAARACSVLVKAYNLEVYQGILHRWLGQKILGGTWSQDKLQFGELFDLFRSRQDNVASPTAYHSYLSFQPIITARLASGR